MERDKKRKRDESDEESEEERKTKKEKKSKKDRLISSDDETSSSSSSEDDRSDSEEEKKKKKKHKHKKEKSEKKKKKEKKSKKDKSKKKHKSAAVDQHEYGSFGVVRESDFYNKQPEFETWLREVKGIAEFNGPKWELMEHFKTFMEDYNTCTFPSDKYYNIAKWEMEEAERQKKKLLKKMSKDGSLQKQMEEEARLAATRKIAKERLEEAHSELKKLDPEKVKAMKEQDLMRTQMQIAFKSGNMSEANRLKNKLKPDIILPPKIPLV